jgi:hypothetical protein
MEPLKSTDAPCNQLIGRWQLTTSWYHYVGVCLAITITIRALQSLFKAWAFKYGDVPDDYKIGLTENPKSYLSLYRECFFSLSLGKNSDLWLPTLIGLGELLTYPVLLVLGQTVVIGAWLAFKTAGAWTGWRTSGTAFNRFLFFSLLNVLLAYVLATHFVQAVPCPVHAVEAMTEVRISHR